MSSNFNLPRVRRDPLGQALDSLPNFLLALGKIQEDKRDREDRAQRANEQALAKKEAFEIELISMADRGGNADIKVRSIKSLRRSITTPGANKALDVAIPMWQEEQKQKRKSELVQAGKERFQGEIDFASLAIKAAGQLVPGANNLVTESLARIAALAGVSPPQDTTQTAPPDTTEPDPLGLDLRTAGFGARGRKAATPEPSLEALFDVSDPSTVGGIVSPSRKQGTLSVAQPLSLDSLQQLLNSFNATR